jgi:hypothetical protein
MHLLKGLLNLPLELLDGPPLPLEGILLELLLAFL